MLKVPGRVKISPVNTIILDVHILLKKEERSFSFGTNVSCLTFSFSMFAMPLFYGIRYLTSSLDDNKTKSLFLLCDCLKFPLNFYFAFLSPLLSSHLYRCVIFSYKCIKNSLFHMFRTILPVIFSN
ncbi:hypothetical protein Dimus_024388 [Dionaea muscipula]